MPTSGIPTEWPLGAWSGTGLRNSFAPAAGYAPFPAPTGGINGVAGQPRHYQPELPPGSCGSRAHTQRPLWDLLEMVHAVFLAKNLEPRLPTAVCQQAVPAPSCPGEGELSRNYMAGFGRWISRVGFEQQALGEHPYGYAMNNPINYIDPNGNAPQNPQQRPQKPPPALPSVGQGGSGNTCPGKDAYTLVMNTIARNPSTGNDSCAAAIRRVCPNGFAAEVALIPFIIGTPTAPCVAPRHP